MSRRERHEATVEPDGTLLFRLHDRPLPVKVMVTEDGGLVFSCEKLKLVVGSDSFENLQEDVFEALDLLAHEYIAQGTLSELVELLSPELPARKVKAAGRATKVRFDPTLVFPWHEASAQAATA